MDPSALADLLPHGPEMTIIDRLVAFEGQRSVAMVEITPRSKFFVETGVPAWVGIEYMAQAVAAHAGFEARLRGDAPSIGFLLGTRSYECFVPEFPAGAKLKIAVERVLVDGGFGSFACTIKTDRILAKALLNTYQPSDAEIAKIREARGGE
jgi:predicted hotdog family 3-hydroxylacyl-ACP dehydratase